jgi:hypothetical protein
MAKHKRKGSSVECQCDICGVTFHYISSNGYRRKTCGYVCGEALRRMVSKPGHEGRDPTPEQIAERSRRIREINEHNKRHEIRANALPHQLEWLTEQR